MGPLWDQIWVSESRDQVPRRQRQKRLLPVVGHNVCINRSVHLRGPGSFQEGTFEAGSEVRSADAPRADCLRVQLLAGSQTDQFLFRRKGGSSRALSHSASHSFRLLFKAESSLTAPTPAWIVSPTPGFISAYLIAGARWTLWMNETMYLWCGLN